MQVVGPRIGRQRCCVAPVLPTLAGGHQGLRQPLHPGQPQVVAVGGDGVHAHRRIAQQRAAWASEALCVHGHQRVGVALAQQLHVAQSVLELGLHFGRESGTLQRQHAGGVGGLGGHHHGALRVAAIDGIGQR